MQVVSALFKQYAALPEREVNIRVVIGAKFYDTDTVVEFEIGDNLIAGDEFVLGAVISSTLTFSIVTPDVILVDKAIVPYVKLNGASGWTEWVPLGVFWIDSKKLKSNNVCILTCFDRLIETQKVYVPTVTFPALTGDILTDMCTQIGVGIHVDTTAMIAANNYSIDSAPPIDMSLRDMLSNLSVMYGCCVRIDKQGKLCFIPFSGTQIPTPIGPSEYIKCEQTNSLKAYTSILCMTSTTDSLTAGLIGDIPDRVLNCSCIFMTQSILETVIAKLEGFSYMPIVMHWRGFPYIEVGDRLEITLRNGTIFKTTLLLNKMSFKGGMVSNSESPSLSENESKYVFTGYTKDLVTDVVKLKDEVRATVWVQPDVPSTAKPSDVWVDTDDYSRYDKTALLLSTTLLISDNEIIIASGTILLTLHVATTIGVIKKIYNIGSGIVTLVGTINGLANMLLYPGESIELITDGSEWRC